MTFAVIEVGAGSEKVVGTIWASGESEAQTIASDLLGATDDKAEVELRRSEEREIPMKPFN